MVCKFHCSCCPVSGWDEVMVVVCSHPSKDDGCCPEPFFFFVHRWWCLVFLFNEVVFTFFQTKELNEVVLGNWFRTGVGGGRPFPSWLLVIDDVGVLCHNYQVLLSVIFIQLLRRNLAIINELDIKSQTVSLCYDSCRCRRPTVSKKSCVQKNQRPPLWFVIFTETPPCSWKGGMVRSPS